MKQAKVSAVVCFKSAIRFKVDVESLERGGSKVEGALIGLSCFKKGLVSLKKKDLSLTFLIRVDKSFSTFFKSTRLSVGINERPFARTETSFFSKS